MADAVQLNDTVNVAVGVIVADAESEIDTVVVDVAEYVEVNVADFVYVADTVAVAVRVAVHEAVVEYVAVKDAVDVLVEVTVTDAVGVTEASSLRGSLPLVVSVAAIIRCSVLS